MKKRLIILLLAVVFMFAGCDIPAGIPPEEMKKQSKVEDSSKVGDEFAIKTVDEIVKKEKKDRTFSDELKKDAPAVDFDVVDLEGNKLKLNDILREDVLTYVDFFQTTCHFCVEAMPELMELNKRDDVQVVLVDVGESVEQVKKFMEEKKIELPVVVDESGDVAQKYYISGFPTGVFIKGDGTLKGGVVGKRPLEELKQIVEKFK